MAATTGSLFNTVQWQRVVVSTLALWLGGSLLLDLVIMPGMYAAGFMAQDGFAATGYSMFWIVNRIELVCSALILTGVFALRQSTQPYHYPRWATGYAIALFLIPTAFTYILTPAMSSLGFHSVLDQNSIPVGMDQLHGLYWMLEVSKIGIAIALFRLMHRLDTES